MNSHEKSGRENGVVEKREGGRWKCGQGKAEASWDKGARTDVQRAKVSYISMRQEKDKYCNTGQGEGASLGMERQSRIEQ